MKKITLITLIAFVFSSCSFYVADQNKKYGHPVNEINTEMQLISGYKIGESLKYDKLNGHYYFRFSDILKGEKRNVDIFIPKNCIMGNRSECNG